MAVPPVIGAVAPPPTPPTPRGGPPPPTTPTALRWPRPPPAPADDIFGNRIRGLGAALIGNAFPLAREGAIRRSLELLGARLDRGFSILIFPPGKPPVGGRAE